MLLLFTYISQQIKENQMKSKSTTKTIHSTRRQSKSMFNKIIYLTLLHDYKKGMYIHFFVYIFEIYELYKVTQQLPVKRAINS